MGALIQTKGTQRLAKNFNTRFIDLNAARSWVSTGAVRKTFGGNLPDAFDKGALDLLQISDSFIAQNATFNSWPSDGNDILYPSATMTATVASTSTAISFALPTGYTNTPSMIAQGSSVISLDKRGAIPPNTTVSAPPNMGGGGNFTVSLSQGVNVGKNERICFISGAHQRLVRRWRWYLAHDLKAENDNAIKDAISSALDDSDFQSITFQTVEDTQKVATNVEQLLDPTTFEFINQFVLHIVLLTQKTTAPDQQD